MRRVDANGNPVGRFICGLTQRSYFNIMTNRVEHLAEGVTLYCRDCREIVPTLGRFDAILTDPPYEAVMHKAKAKAAGRGRTLRTDGGPSLQAIDFDAIDDIREEVCSFAKDCCDGWFIAFCSPEGVAPWRDAIEAAGFRYKRACFWNKPDAAPQFNGQGPAFAVEAFVTAWCGHGVSKWNGGGRRNLFTHPTNSPDRDGRHPTEKPVSLMLELTTLFTSAGETILDPFMGSGTTGVAAVKLGRQFVGVERDEKYFDLAVRRISDALKQPDMFIAKPKPIRQEAFI
jgi:DNA modification methylase